MKNLKNKVDAYFDLEHNPEGQLLYYGMIGVMLIVVVSGTIGSILT